MSKPRFVPGLALRVLRQITDYPETWDQRVFECGTQRDVAGWAVFFMCGSVNEPDPTMSAARFLGIFPRVMWAWGQLFNADIDPRPALAGLARRDHLLTCSVGSAWSDRMREVAR